MILQEKQKIIFPGKSKIMENSNDRWVPDNPPIPGTFWDELFERLTLSRGEGAPQGAGVECGRKVAERIAVSGL